MDFISIFLDGVFECSVCLDRLRADARVLPCQHTFCYECLKRLKNKNPSSPLTCPECRNKTNVFEVDQLPKNVFLIRILDQMKITSPNSSITSTTSEIKGCPSSPAKATSQAECDNKTSPPKPPVPNESHQQINGPYAKALYDFRMNPLEDEGCLKFQKGSMIQVTRRVDQSWAEGKIGDTVGIFPLSFVEMNPAAQQLMHSYATKWRLPATMPPVSNKDQTPSTSTSPQRPPLQPTPVLQPMIRPLSPNVQQQNHIPTSSAAINNPLPISQPSQTAGTPLNIKQSTNDKTGRYIALHSYSPQKPDELELKKGAQYFVKEVCQDGWLKGVGVDNPLQKGVFPGNYVMPLLYHQKMISMQRSLAAQKNNSGGRAATGAYTSNMSLSIVPPELPQRIPSRSAPLNKSDTSSETPICAQQQKTDENKQPKKESMTEMLMKKLGYNRKSNDSTASSYSMDNPVFEDNTTTPNFKASIPLQFNHMRSGSCPSRFVCPADLGIAVGNNENLQFGSQRVKPRARVSIPMANDDKAINDNSQKRHSMTITLPPTTPGTSKTNQNTQLNAQHRKSSSLDTTLDATSAAQQLEKYRCIEKYPAHSRFELSLSVGDIIIVQKKRDNGWYKGELTRTGQVGLFPANFVEILKD